METLAPSPAPQDFDFAMLIPTIIDARLEETETLAPLANETDSTLAPKDDGAETLPPDTHDDGAETLSPTGMETQPPVMPHEGPETLMPATTNNEPGNDGAETLSPTTTSTTTMGDQQTTAPSSSSNATTTNTTEMPQDEDETKVPTTPTNTVPTSEESLTTAPATAPVVVAPTTEEEPTNEPKAVFPVVGHVNLQILSTTSMLMGVTETKFLKHVEAFLKLKIPQVQFLTAQIVRQYRRRGDRRQLESQSQPDAIPLFVDLGVSGRQYLTNEDDVILGFDDTLKRVFVEHGEELVNALQASGDPYFATFGVVTLNLNLGDSAPAGAPTTGLNPTSTTPEEENGDDFISLPFIIAITVGGMVFLVLMGLVCKRMMDKPETTFNQVGGANGEGGSAPKRFWRRKKNQLAEDTQSSTSGFHSLKEVNSDLNSDLESQAMYSYAQDNESFFGGVGKSFGIDNLSYAYSLDAGIEPSVMGGATVESSIPTEIPQIQTKMKRRGKKPNSQVSVSTNDNVSVQDHQAAQFAPNSSFEEMDQTIELAPSELQLTASEIAMLPAGTTIGKSSTSEEEELPGRTTILESHEVVAPPGKLGLVIDTTVDGPVVHHVNDGSALKGKIWPGDIIVAIDDIDTRAMSASAITTLMIKTANQRRRLTVISDDPADTHPPNNEN